jgi:hypothetical protein
VSHSTPKDWICCTGSVNRCRHTYTGGITFHKHLGSERHKEKEMKRHFESDVVFSTFATIAQDLMRGTSPLANIHYFRIVLDEGEIFSSLNSPPIINENL